MIIPFSKSTWLNIGSFVTVPIAGAIMKGSVAALANDDKEIILQEGFAVKFIENPKNQALTAAVSGSIYMASVWWLTRKIRLGERIKIMAPLLRVMGEIMREIDQLTKLISESSVLDNAYIIMLDAATRKLEFMSLMVIYLDTPELLDMHRLQMNHLLARTVSSGLLDDSPELLNILAEMRSFIVKPSLVTQEASDIMYNLMSPDSVFGYSFDNISKKLSKLNDKMTRVPFSSGDDLITHDEIIKNWGVYGKAEFNLFDDISRDIKMAVSQEARLHEIGKRSQLVGKFGRLNLFDLIWWGVAGGVDLMLNPFVDEDKQYIPILVDIPWFGKLFDLRESFGTSPIGTLLIEPMINGLVELFLDEEDIDNAYTALMTAVLVASQNDDISGLVNTLLEFWFEDIEYEGSVDMLFDTPPLLGNVGLLRLALDIDPMMILEWCLYGLVGKVFVKRLVLPLLAPVSPANGS